MNCRLKNRSIESPASLRDNEFAQRRSNQFVAQQTGSLSRLRDAMDATT